MNLIPRAMKRKWLSSWKAVAAIGILVTSIWYFEIDSYVLGTKPRVSKKSQPVKLKPSKTIGKQNHDDHLKIELQKLDRISMEQRKKSYVKLAHILSHTNILKETHSDQRSPILSHNHYVKKEHTSVAIQYQKKQKVLPWDSKDGTLKKRDDKHHGTITAKKKFPHRKTTQEKSSSSKQIEKLQYFQRNGDSVAMIRNTSQTPRTNTDGGAKLKNHCQSYLDEVPVDKQEFLLVQDRPVYLFSAYLDTRKDNGRPHIRIIAAGLQLAYNKIPPMFCTTWWRDKNNKIFGVNSGVVKYKVIYESTMWPKMYTSHFILCDIPSTDAKLVAVSIVAQPCSRHIHALPIQTLVAPEKNIPHTFSLCISPLYGKVSHVEIVEFIEIHRLLGVEKFTLYKHSISPKLDKLFDYYKKDGVVNIVNWKFPGHVEQSYFMQRVALNDCLYRNMAESKFVGIYDLDEVVVPNKGESWSRMFLSLKKDYPSGGAFLFQHAYFRRNNSIKLEPNLFTQNSRWRTSKVYPKGKIRCKSIHYAQRSLAVDIHFPYSLLPGYEEVIVKPETAILHHYRKTPMSSFNKKKDLEFVEDNTLLRYGQDLKIRTSKVLKSIG